MNREHGTNVAVAVLMPIVFTQQQWNHRRMPIMTVQDIRNKIKNGQNFQYRSIKKSKPFSIIPMTIYSLSSKIALVIDEVYWNSFMF
ncbi:hypothetical protein D3C81_1740540 [compost metagenome]